MNIIDLKLIDAYSTLCFYKDDNTKTIEEILDEVKVPEKYREQVGIRIAERRIRILGGATDGI